MHASMTSSNSLISTTCRWATPVQVMPVRLIRLPKPAVRHANRLTTAAQKSKEGKETAKEVDAKLDKVFDHIEKAEEEISAGNIEQDTAMEERQKDPRFAEAKDALDLKEKELAPAASQKQGQK
ncbi:hypothetical protein ABBQ38_011052 [Trebouxia sp. C0009 RCD-2024]